MLILQVHVIEFLPEKRSLQPIGRLPSRGIAPSGFRPLRKIPHCCLPQESGPCLSSSVSDRPLKPDTDRRLGRPLPHQLANQPRALPKADKSISLGSIWGFSNRFQLLSPSLGQILTCYSPVRHLGMKPSYDLHVLGIPPAFILSQDQTLLKFPEFFVYI